MRYSYYPGCSLHATGVAYDKSMRATFKAIGADLVELDDWNCCGATAYMSVKETVACAVSARNLAIAEQAGLDVVAPCSACFTVLTKTQMFMKKVPALRAQVDESLKEAGLSCRFEVRVRHPLDVLINDIGIKQLAARQVRDLRGLRVACYYGCQIVRPEKAVIDDDPDLPMSVDNLLAGLGATPVPYSPKVRCCGGMLVATFESVARKLTGRLADWARMEGADCIATTCPMCQANLEMLQQGGDGIGTTRPMVPAVYFTQLVGIAMGCSERDVGMHHNLIPLKFDFPRVAQREARSASETARASSQPAAEVSSHV